MSCFQVTYKVTLSAGIGTLEETIKLIWELRL